MHLLAWPGAGRGHRLILTGMIAIFAAILATIYVANEHGYYFWDFRNFWTSYQTVGDGLWADPGATLQNLRRGVRDSEYNELFAVPLAPFRWLLGDGRTGFIISVAVIYLTPTVLVTALASRFVIRRRMELASGAFLLLVGAALLYPPYWTPTFRGIVDIGGVAALGAATLLVLQVDWLNRILPGRAVLLGLLIWAPFVFRKWYAYAIVVFALTAFCYVAWQCWSANNRPDMRKLRNVVANFAIAGIAAALLAIVFQSGLLRLATSTQFGNLYEAYQLPFWSHFGRIFEQFGVVPLVLAAFGAYRLISRRDTRSLGLFLVANPVLTYLFFAPSQAPLIHHFLPMAFWIFLLASVGGAEAIGSLAPRHRKAGVFAIGAACVAMFVATYTPLPQPLRVVADVIHPAARVYPLTLAKPDGYAGLKNQLDALIGPSDTLTVFAASRMDSESPMSDGVINALEDHNLDRAVLRASDVDRRDGLPIEPLLARYAIVADPIQTGLWAKYQLGIVAPAQRLLARQGIGAAYHEVGERFDLGNGVHVGIFEKARAFTPAEVDELLEQFYGAYPDWRERAAFHRLLLQADVRASDVDTPISVSSDGSLTLKLGLTEPAEITLHAPVALAAIRLSVTHLSGCAPSLTPVTAVWNAGGQSAPFDLTDDKPIVLDLTSLAGGAATLSVKSNANAGCVSVRLAPA